jgi:UDP-N-acetylglucosamine enolpyruvyl transferase
MVSPTSAPGWPSSAPRCARGTSTIMNAHQVDRGYEHIDERRAVGARI